MPHHDRGRGAAAAPHALSIGWRDLEARDDRRVRRVLDGVVDEQLAVLLVFGMKGQTEQPFLVLFFRGNGERIQQFQIAGASRTSQVIAPAMDLTAIPPDSTRSQPDGSHSGNPDVRAHKGMPEHVAWAFERPGGGRGFGFTGAHFHKNWGNDNFRKLVLNALLWTAKMEVPPGGVQSKVTAAELEKHLDLKPAK